MIDVCLGQLALFSKLHNQKPLSMSLERLLMFIDSTHVVNILAFTQERWATKELPVRLRIGSIRVSCPMEAWQNGQTGSLKKVKSVRIQPLQPSLVHDQIAVSSSGIISGAWRLYIYIPPSVLWGNPH